MNKQIELTANVNKSISPNLKFLRFKSSDKTYFVPACDIFFVEFDDSFKDRIVDNVEIHFTRGKHVNIIRVSEDIEEVMKKIDDALV